jgi:cytoskeletal protein CcmA (bactofilin family)
MELDDPLAFATVPPKVTDFFRSSDEMARPAATPQTLVGSGDNLVDSRTLVVGREISFAGTIASCDRLIVEGSVEAQLQNCQNLIIAATGAFSGSSLTENADVHGCFEGDLVVRKRLLIRPTGRVSGKISYGEIEIERGGQISGEIEA